MNDYDWWRDCDHPRTDANTALYPAKPKGQCRACKRKAGVRYNHSAKGRARNARYRRRRG